MVAGAAAVCKAAVLDTLKNELLKTRILNCTEPYTVVADDELDPDTEAVDAVLGTPPNVNLGAAVVVDVAVVVPPTNND